jgi:hypothetical protein
VEETVQGIRHADETEQQIVTVEKSDLSNGC